MPAKRSRIKWVYLVVVVCVALLGLLLAARWMGAQGWFQAPPVVRPMTSGQLKWSVFQLIQEGIRQRSKAKFQQAETLLRGSLARAQDKAMVHALLARLELERWEIFSSMGSGGPPATALQQAREALRLNPRCALALEILSCYHERNANITLALEAGDRWLALAPNDMRALIHKSRCLLYLKRYAEAEKVLGHAHELALAGGRDHELVKVQEFLGKVYTGQGKYKQAERVLLASVQTIKRSKLVMAACPYTALGELYGAMGDEKKVAESFIKAADREARWPKVQYRAAAKCLEIGDYDNARKYIRRALALSNDAAFHTLKARIEARIRQQKPAPRSPGQAFQAALASFELNHFDAAKGHLDRALAASSGEVGYKVLQGFLLLLEKKYARAGELFRQVQKVQPGEAGAEVGLGHLAIIRKDYTAARRLLRTTVKRGYREAGRPGGDAPLRPQSYRWLVYRMACLGLGWVLANQNRHLEAIRYFDRVLAHKKDDIFSLLGKGNSLNALNKLTEAERTLKRVLALNPANKYATAELALVKFNRGQD